MQIEGEPNHIKQLKLFQLIESNCQFMTVMRRLVNHDAEKNFYEAEEYIKNNSQIRIDYQNFIQCFIQVAYLIYAGKYYGLNPIIQKKDVRIQEKVQQTFHLGIEKKFNIIIFYSFHDTARDTNSYAQIVKQIYQFLMDLYNLYETKVKPHPLDNQYRAMIGNFVQQNSIINQKLVQFQNVEKQKQFFFYLQQTDLFRQKSMLLKIKNASILDYIKMKVNKFKQSRDNDVRMVNQYNNEKKKMKCDHQQLKKKQKLIQKNILQFFQAIQRTNKSKFKIKIETDQNFKSKFVLISYDLQQQQFLDRINKVRRSQDSMVAEEAPRDKCPYTEYQIQYNSQKNSICVRLVLSSIVTSPQNADYIMFQSNVLTFESANISLQFVDDKASQKAQPGRKNLAFRGASCFNSKQPTLQKILILMDLTMIAAKIYQPQLLLIRKNFMVDKDVHKLSILYQKVNHYSKVFLRCARKVYSQ